MKTPGKACTMTPCQALVKAQTRQKKSSPSSRTALVCPSLCTRPQSQPPPLSSVMRSSPHAQSEIVRVPVHHPAFASPLLEADQHPPPIIPANAIAPALPPVASLMHAQLPSRWSAPHCPMHYIHGRAWHATRPAHMQLICSHLQRRERVHHNAQISMQQLPPLVHSAAPRPVLTMAALPERASANYGGRLPGLSLSQRLLQSPRHRGQPLE